MTRMKLTLVCLMILYLSNAVFGLFDVCSRSLDVTLAPGETWNVTCRVFSVESVFYVDFTLQATTRGNFIRALLLDDKDYKLYSEGSEPQRAYISESFKGTIQEKATSFSLKYKSDRNIHFLISNRAERTLSAQVKIKFHIQEKSTIVATVLGVTFSGLFFCCCYAVLTVVGVTITVVKCVRAKSKAQPVVQHEISYEQSLLDNYQLSSAMDDYSVTL